MRTTSLSTSALGMAAAHLAPRAQPWGYRPVRRAGEPAIEKAPLWMRAGLILGSSALLWGAIATLATILGRGTI